MVLSDAKSPANSPRVLSETRSAVSSPKASGASPKASGASPRASEALPNPSGSSASTSEDIDFSLTAWITNTHSILHSPLTILSVLGLVVLGSFVEIAPRKSLEFLDTTLGRSLFFVLPFLIAILIDWATGLLAATVSLIIFARLQKQDGSEGFSDVTNDSLTHSTNFISSPHRWFIERVLGESPFVISSENIATPKLKDIDSNSSSSMASHSMPNGSSSSSSMASHSMANGSSSSSSNK